MVKIGEAVHGRRGDQELRCVTHSQWGRSFEWTRSCQCCGRRVLADNGPYCDVACRAEYRERLEGERAAEILGEF